MRKSRMINRVWVRGLLAMSLMVTILPVGVGAETTIVERMVKEERSLSEAVADLKEAKYSREQAIEIAKKIAGNVDSYSGPEVSRRNRGYSPYDSKNSREIRWRKDGPDFSFIEVSVDAETGMIRNYNRGGKEEEKNMSFPPKVKYEQTEEIANEFLKKIYGDKVQNFKIDPREGQDWGKVIRNPHDTYEVRYIELVNGVSFPRNTISVRIDSNGQIKNLYYNSMNQVSFEAKQDVLSKEQIREKLKQNIEMELAYQIQYPKLPPIHNKKEDNVYLSFVPSKPFSSVDAQTGELLTYNGQSLVGHVDREPLAEKQQSSPPKKLEKPLTQDQVLSILEKVINVPEDVTISSMELNESDWRGRSTWRIQFEYQHAYGGMGWTGGQIDPDTGEILSFDLSQYLREKTQQETKESEKEMTTEKDFPVTYEQAKQKALSFVREQSKDKLHELYLQNQSLDNPNRFNPFYRFQFERYVNGVKVPFNQVRVGVSADTGKVVEFNQNWDHTIKLPKANNVIDKTKAKAIYLDQLNLHLEYQVIDDKGGYRRSPLDLRKDNAIEASLVYRVQHESHHPSFIDAFTGELLDPRTGKQIEEKEQGYELKNIQGHWAEKELTYLLKLKVIREKDGKPDTVVTRAGFYDMLMKLVEGSNQFPYFLRDKQESSFKDVPSSHKYYPAIEWAVSRNLLEKKEKFNPDQPLIREEAAQILVRALGYEKLAKDDQLFRLNFADRAQIDYPGSVAIIQSLEIMQGNGDKFFPDQPLTLAQAGVTLFRYMEKRNQYRPDIRLR